MNKKPNILYILSDDHGAWAMHCAGNDEINTPSLDRIAENGMRFESFFCVSPVCSPARASLLTGTIPSAHGVHDWLCGGNVDREKAVKQVPNNPYCSFSDEDKPIQYLSGHTAYTDILTQNGYNCALSGKWHMGDSLNPQHGFKQWYTISKGGCCYYHPDMVEDGKITLEDGKYITDLITDKALTFLEELNDDESEKPFYLSVHYTAPHAPWGEDQHPKEFIDMYDKCDFHSTPDVPDHRDHIAGAEVYGTPKRHINLRGYYAAITAMDYNIGRILDRLDALGIAENTIVIFNGDNGMSMGHHGVWGKGNGTFPMNMYDTAVKVPFIISYPGVIEKNVVCHDMASGYDFFPTLLDLLGLDKSATRKLPGKSFYPSLIGKTAHDTCGADGDDGDGDVVVFDEYGPVRMIRSREYKYIHRYPYGYNEFYDLKNDPEENNNLIDDKNYADKILEMRQRLEKWFIRYVNPDLDGTKEGVTGSGQYCSAGAYAQKLKKYATEG